MKSTFYLAHYRDADRACQSVKTHLDETSCFAKQFAGKVGLDLIGELLGLLHDLGKYSDVYQCYIKSAVGLLRPGDENYMDPRKFKGKIDHATAGAQWIWEALKDEQKINKLLVEIVALSVFSHHSGLNDVFDVAGEDKFSKRLNKKFTSTHYPEVQVKIDHSIAERIDEIVRSEVKNNQLRNVINRIHDHFREPIIRSFARGLFASEFNGGDWGYHSGIWHDIGKYLETLFGGGTRCARRMHQLAKSAIIFDRTSFKI